MFIHDKKETKYSGSLLCLMLREFYTFKFCFFKKNIFCINSLDTTKLVRKCKTFKILAGQPISVVTPMSLQ